MVRQNVTFQESQKKKTKSISIVFAIFKDFSRHFEGVLFVVGSNNFFVVIRHELEMTLDVKSEIDIFGPFSRKFPP